MARRVVWTLDAKHDLIEIWEYIARDSIAYASITIKAIRSAVRGLIQFPLKAKVITEFERENLRSLVTGNFRIIYRVTENMITIERILHTSRDLLRHFDPNLN